MSPKVRLDLMVSEETKRFLMGFAREQGVSMSEMVDQLIIEHLMHMPVGDDSAPDPSAAVMDMLKIQELQGEVTEAISKGMVWSVDEYAMLSDATRIDRQQEAGGLVYVPTDSPYYASIVCDGQFDEIHSDVISTYGGGGHPSYLETVDAYLEWYEDNDERHLNGLCIVPKGKDPGRAIGVIDWEAPATWPEGMPEPWNEKNASNH